MYTHSLFWAIGACVTTRVLLSSSSKQVVDLTSSNKPSKEHNDISRRGDFKVFQRSFLTVALLAMFSDWIQGPYSYALYAHYGGLFCRRPGRQLRKEEDVRRLRRVLYHLLSGQARE
ncbi:Protein of unknown function DUF791 [Nannochloropsis gaditana]|uniref:Uncharacterized protein n=1 Tax=Nannochloropsis gaditana TaxID=72520 RepID=W7TJJ3_9STRA|nr:Protein of unknown function DUF791 [Nannochloropsis gaditana]